MPNRLLAGPAPHVVAATVMTAAALFESGAGNPGSALEAVDVLGSVAIGLSILLAYWSPFGGVLLLIASLTLPTLFVELPRTGGAHLIASMLLVGYAAYRLRQREGVAAYALAALLPALTVMLAGQTVWEFAFYTLILGPAWVVGVLLRREQERSAELMRLTEALRVEREKQAQVAVAAERTRISRELHDAVAHTVSVMTLQVGVVRRRLKDQPVEEETLRGAETLGRQAVDELRRIVGLVRDGESAALAPLPSLAQLDELVEHVRSTGTPVRVTVEGTVEQLPHAVDMSAYRIVQEALTNALRHAPGAEVTVEVVVRGDEVTLAVVNDAPARAPVPQPAGGHGLPGMQERAAVLGGSLSAEPHGDGFAVRARLPLSAPARLGSSA